VRAGAPGAQDRLALEQHVEPPRVIGLERAQGRGQEVVGLDVAAHVLGVASRSHRGGEGLVRTAGVHEVIGDRSIVATGSVVLPRRLDLGRATVEVLERALRDLGLADLVQADRRERQ
jgi:hypothetical protein